MNKVILIVTCFFCIGNLIGQTYNQYNIFYPENEFDNERPKLGFVNSVDNEIFEKLYEEKLDLISFEVYLNGNEKVTLNLKKKSLYSENGLVVKSASGTTQIFGEGIYYDGKIDEEEKSTVIVSIFPSRMVGLIQRGSNSVYNLKHLYGATNGEHIVHKEEDLDINRNFVCNASEVASQDSLTKEEEIGKKLISYCASTLHIYYEMDHIAYIDQTSEETDPNIDNIESCIHFITHLHNAQNTVFSNIGNTNNNGNPAIGGSIELLISEIFIWDIPDQYPVDLVPRLQAFSDYRADFNGDLAHLINKGLVSTGGIAFAGSCGTTHDQICNQHLGGGGPFSISLMGSETTDLTIQANQFLSSYETNLVAHEIAHNLGGRHVFTCTWQGANGSPLAITNQCLPIGTQSEPCPTNCDAEINSGYESTVMSYCWGANSSGLAFINYESPFHLRVADNILTNTCNIGNCELYDALTNDCIDNDFDGFCINDPDECDDFNPLVPANEPTPCNDGDNLTINDSYNIDCVCIGTDWSNPSDAPCNLIVGGDLSFDDRPIGWRTASFYNSLEVSWSGEGHNMPSIANVIKEGACNTAIGLLGRRLNNGGFNKEGFAIELSHPIPCGAEIRISLDYHLFDNEVDRNILDIQGSHELISELNQNCNLPLTVSCFIDTPLIPEPEAISTPLIGNASFGDPEWENSYAFNLFQEDCSLELNFETWSEVITVPYSNSTIPSINFLYFSFNIPDTSLGSDDTDMLLIDNLLIEVLPESSYELASFNEVDCQFDIELHQTDACLTQLIVHKKDQDDIFLLEGASLDCGFETIAREVQDCWPISLVQTCPPCFQQIIIDRKEPECQENNPIITFENNNPILCEEDVMTLHPETSNGANLEWNWSTSETTQNITVGPGTYTVTVTDLDSNCSSSESITVGLETVEWNSFANPNCIILDQNPPQSSLITIVGEPSDFVQFIAFLSFNGNIIEGVNLVDDVWEFEVTEAGVYYIEVFGDNCSDLGTIEIFSNEESLDPQFLTICPGETLILNSSGNPFTDTFEWWDLSSNEIVEDANESSLIVTEPGLYSVNITTTNDCVFIENFNVIDGSESIDFSQELNNFTICEGESLILNPDLDESLYTFAWNTGESSSTIEVSSPGNYSLTVTNTETLCTATNSIEIQDGITAIINSDSGMFQFCESESIALSATINNALGDATINWSNGLTGENIVVSETGSFGVTVTDDHCSSSSSVTVVELPVQQPTFEIQPICNGEGGALIISNPSLFTEITWDDGSMSASPNQILAQVYSVTVSDENGCLTSAQVELPDVGVPNFEIFSDPAIICGQNPVSLTIDIEGQPGIEVDYPIVNGTGTYTVTVTNTIDEYSCQATDDIILEGLNCIGNTPILNCDVFPPTLTIDVQCDEEVEFTLSWFENGEEMVFETEVPESINAIQGLEYYYEVNIEGCSLASETLMVNCGSFFNCPGGISECPSNPLLSTPDNSFEINANTNSSFRDLIDILNIPHTTSSNGFAFENLVFKITGDLNIDTWCEFRHCTFYFEGGVLNLSGTSRVRILENSVLTSCGGERWEGIQTSEGGFLTLNNAYISNAIRGITLVPNTSISMRQSCISNCYTGVHTKISDTGSLVASNFSGNQIIDCTTGIYTNINFDYNSGETTMIENCGRGIHIRDLAMASISNINIRGSDGEYGIYLNGASNGIIELDELIISGYRTGIVAFSQPSNLSINNATIDLASTENGETNSGEASIWNTGIDIPRGSGGTFNVSNTSITGPSAMVLNRLSENDDPSTTMSFAEANIQLDANDCTETAIQIPNCSNMTFENCNISGAAQIGIQANNSQFIEIQGGSYDCGTVGISAMYPQNFSIRNAEIEAGERDIDLIHAINWFICGNDLKGKQNGSFLHNCDEDGEHYLENTHNNDLGLSISGSDIGPNEFGGNKFIGGTKGQLINVVDQSEFLYNPSGPDPDCWRPIVDGTEWFVEVIGGQSNSTGIDCAEVDPYNPPSETSDPDDNIQDIDCPETAQTIREIIRGNFRPGLSQSARTIQTNEVINMNIPSNPLQNDQNPGQNGNPGQSDGNPGQNDPIAIQDCYLLLAEVIGNFQTENENISKGKLAKLEKRIDRVSKFEQTSINQINELLDKMVLLREENKSLDPYNEQEFQKIIENNDKIQVHAEEIDLIKREQKDDVKIEMERTREEIIEIEALDEVDSTRKVSLLIQSEMSLYPATEVFERYFEEIDRMSKMCDLDFGRPVYLARIWKDLFNPQEKQDYSNSCSVKIEGRELRKNTKNFVPTIIPNPNAGHFSIHGLPLHESIDISIISMSGFQVFENTFITENKIVEIQSKGLLPGIYIVQIDSNSLIWNKKIIVLND